MMFFHVPWQESYDAADVSPSSDWIVHVKQVLADSRAAKKSAGSLRAGLLQAPESSHRAGARVPQAKVVVDGRCHMSENCKRVNGVWLCFGGGGHIVP
ncbi:hypothetical protein V8D89_001969 [Ganoderma adspersum]